MDSNVTFTNLQDSRKSYFFHGKFVPERANIRLSYTGIGARLENKQVRFNIFAFGSEFNGKISSSIPFENIPEVQSTVCLLLRSILDRVSYLNACGYDIDLIGAVSAEGHDHQIFGVNEPIFYGDVNQQWEFARKQIPFADELLELKFHNARLDHALRCFCHAMRDDALTPLFCYIAIEVLVRAVVEIVEQKKIDDVRNGEWITFRKSLNLKEITIKTDIKTLADDFRHGNFINTSWDDRKKILSLTWEIIRRAMHFMKSKAALDAPSFPEL